MASAKRFWTNPKKMYRKVECIGIYKPTPDGRQFTLLPTTPKCKAIEFNSPQAAKDAGWVKA